MSEKSKLMNRILVIEDHVPQARLMAQLLSRHDPPFEVEVVHDAESGLDKMKQSRFDAVVLDYSLPRLNGLQALEIIKKRNINCPVIMVTGQGDERIAVEAMRRGAHDYLVKNPDTMNLLPRVLVRATAEKALSSRLQKSEQRFYALFEGASIAILIISAGERKILQVNRMAAKLLNADADSLRGTAFPQFCPPEAQAKLENALRKLEREGAVNLDHLLLRRLDGETIPTDLSGSLVRIDEEQFLQLFIRDIREKVNMQRQLMLSRQRLISLFDGITDMISVQDRAHNLIMGNLKYRQFTGVHKRLNGEKCYRALFKRSEPCPNCPAADTLHTGLAKFIEIDHQGRTFHIWTFPMAGLDKRPEFLVEYVKDVTEQVEIEKQLIKSEKLASIGLLSSGIAHELRNPLNVIETTRYSLQDVLGEQNEEIRTKLEMIKKNVRRASFIIENLLQFSRHSEFEREKIDVEDLLNTTLSLLGKEITRQNVSTRLDFQHVPSVFFSIDSLKQVFLNLIMNALQAMPDGGELVLSTALSKGRDWVYVDFKDSGVGIIEEHLKHIFTPFFTTKSDTGGTGLGLYLSYSIIKREGGDILFKSAAGLGSTFTVKLPVARARDVPH